MKRSNWFEGLLEAEKLTLEGYTYDYSPYLEVLVFSKEGSSDIHFVRMDMNHCRDQYFKGMKDYLGIK